MLRATDLKGVVAMMPAFTTKDGASPEAEDTVDTASLTTAVDKIICDGVNAIATMGSFGECHTLLWKEKKKLTEATIAAVRKRVPVLIGCTTLNTRETMRAVRFAQEAGAAGCWSICAWMGPSPLIRLRDACFSGDWETAKQIAIDMSEAYRGPGRPGDLFWRENSHKLVINESGYCHAGPLRPPFRHVPQEIIEHSKKMAENWKELCRKYSQESIAAKASAARGLVCVAG